MIKRIAILCTVLLLAMTACSVWRSIKDRYQPYRMVGKSEGKTLVEFTFDAPSAESVHLAGSFNNWTTPGATVPSGETKNIPIEFKKDPLSGYWKVVFPIAPGKYPYKMIINKTIWKEDGNTLEKVDDGYGGKNSIVNVE